jgi:hypothetical protein
MRRLGTIMLAAAAALALPVIARADPGIRSLPAAASTVFDGAAAGDSAGRAVARIGDVNGDGVADYAVTSQDGTGSVLGGGIVWVVFGPIGSTVDLSSLGAPGDGHGYRIEGGLLGGDVGHSITGLGDLNGDGRADIAIGAPGAFAGVGLVYVVFGQNRSGTGSTILLSALGTAGDTHGYRIDGDGDDQAGMSVADAGDVNGDGRHDLLIGAPGRATMGCVYVVFGKADAGAASSVALGTFGQAAATAGYRILPDAPVRLGNAVANAGDVDGDGRPDQLIGAPGGSAAFVVKGKSSTGLFSDVTVAMTGTGTTWYRISGGSGQAGWSVASVGDLNGDHVAEAAIGNPDAPVGSLNQAGAVTIAFGHPFGPTANVDLTQVGTGAETRGFRIEGDRDFGALGRSVDGLGDVNGDGVPDVAVGSWSEGSAWVVYGRSTGGSGTTIPVATLTTGPTMSGFRLNGPAMTAEIGVASAGDGDGDGRPDLLVSAIEAAGKNGGNAGQAYLVSSYPVPRGQLTSPSGLGQTSVTVGGTANPEGSAATAWIEWGPTTAYGTSTPAQEIGSGGTAVPVSATITGLAPVGTYHARLVVHNGFGTFRTPDQEIVTLAPALTLTVATLDASWKVGRLRGSLTLGGTATSGASLRLTLTAPGAAAAAASIPFTVAAGTFSVKVALPASLLPAAYTMGIEGTSLGVAIQPVVRPLTIAPPTEGIVRTSWLTSYRRGTPKTVIRGVHPVLWAYFQFAVKPASSRARFTVIWIAPSGRRFGGVVGPYVPRFESFHNERRLAYGTWTAKLYSLGRLMSVARITIKR